MGKPEKCLGINKIFNVRRKHIFISKFDLKHIKQIITSITILPFFLGHSELVCLLMPDTAVKVCPEKSVYGWGHGDFVMMLSDRSLTTGCKVEYQEYF